MSHETGGNWLTSKEAAAFLRVHPKHVYRLLRRGLPAQRVGGHWRFTAAELHIWAQRAGETASFPPKGNNKQQLATGEQGAQLMAAADDLPLQWLVAAVNEHYPPSLAWIGAGATPALSWLDGGAVLAVGVLGELCVPTGARLARLHVAHDEFGLIGPHDRPPPRLASLAKGHARLASWVVGTDVRTLLDAVLHREGMDSRRVHQGALTTASHFDVVSAVLRQQALVGVTTGSWARRCGLPFQPLGSRPLGLVVQASALASPVLVRAWEVLQTVAFRQRLEHEGGCDVSEPAAIRYLSARSPEPSPQADGSDAPEHARVQASRGGSSLEPRVVFLTRPSGVDASLTLERLVAELRQLPLRVGGFLELPHRSSRGVDGYDLRRLGGSSRIALARRAARSADAAAGSYARFSFRPAAFARAWSWLQRDVRDADVLVVDGISSREAQGGGHLEALAWACRAPEARLVVVCVRADQLPAVRQRLGRDASTCTQWELSRCELPAHRAALVRAIASQLAALGEPPPGRPLVDRS